MLSSPDARYPKSAPPDVTFPLRYELPSYIRLSLGECYNVRAPRNISGGLVWLVSAVLAIASPLTVQSSTDP